jgi:hypothetical protein
MVQAAMDTKVVPLPNKAQFHRLDLEEQVDERRPCSSILRHVYLLVVLEVECVGEPYPKTPGISLTFPKIAAVALYHPKDIPVDLSVVYHPTC